MSGYAMRIQLSMTKYPSPCLVPKVSAKNRTAREVPVPTRSAERTSAAARAGRRSARISRPPPERAQGEKVLGRDPFCRVANRNEELEEQHEEHHRHLGGIGQAEQEHDDRQQSNLRHGIQQVCEGRERTVQRDRPIASPPARPCQGRPSPAAIRARLAKRSRHSARSSWKKRRDTGSRNDSPACE